MSKWHVRGGIFWCPPVDNSRKGVSEGESGGPGGRKWVSCPLLIFCSLQWLTHVPHPLFPIVTRPCHIQWPLGCGLWADGQGAYHTVWEEREAGAGAGTQRRDPDMVGDAGSSSLGTVSREHKHPGNLKKYWEGIYLPAFMRTRTFGAWFRDKRKDWRQEVGGFGFMPVPWTSWAITWEVLSTVLGSEKGTDEL